MNEPYAGQVKLDKANPYLHKFPNRKARRVKEPRKISRMSIVGNQKFVIWYQHEFCKKDNSVHVIEHTREI